MDLAKHHIITCEYPPQPGGVSDYTRIVAEGLAAAGDEVHVWCPAADGVTPKRDGVVVHREMGEFTPHDLRRASRLLDKFPAPRRLLVQWVPHGYGFRSMNLPFCFWLWRRAAQCGDEVELMVHEPGLGLGEGTLKHNVVALVHRLMTIVLLRAVRRVWVAIPAWERRWQPYTLGRAVEFRWLPVGSNIPVAATPNESQQIRARFVNDDRLLIGHFGANDANTTNLLLQSLPELMAEEATLLLLGHGSREMQAVLAKQNPLFADRIHATGRLGENELSQHISACDLMLQPYIDGISSRRTSAMTALAHGVPVITTSGRLTEPLWAESDAVALAPAQDIAELVRSARRLMPDKTARERLGKTARRFYDEHFDTARTIATLRDGLQIS